MKYKDQILRGACLLATFLAIIPLFALLAYVTYRGVAGLSFSFFTELPKPVGEIGGGVANAIVGTLIIAGIACLISVPLGVLAGVHLAEFGENRFAELVRFSADVLSGIPSIVIGIFAYTLVVRPMKTFSALAGGIALSVLMIPTITRTTEELLKLVPHSLREAGLALGLPKWRASLSIVVRTALPGIVTGILLALSRAAGETAPLIFTAFGNQHWSNSLTRPMAALPLQIYTYAISPYEDWHQKAWAAAFVLVAIILMLSVISRIAVKKRGLVS